MLDSISKLVSRFYNLIPNDLKIIIFPAFFTMIIGYLGLATKWLQSFLASNPPEVAVPVLLFIITVLAGIIGYIQKKIANRGEVVQVQEGDKKTIEKLETKVAATQEVLNKAP